MPPRLRVRRPARCGQQGRIHQNRLQGTFLQPFCLTSWPTIRFLTCNLASSSHLGSEFAATAGGLLSYAGGRPCQRSAGRQGFPAAGIVVEGAVTNLWKDSCKSEEEEDRYCHEWRAGHRWATKKMTAVGYRSPLGAPTISPASFVPPGQLGGRQGRSVPATTLLCPLASWLGWGL